MILSEFDWKCKHCGHINREYYDEDLGPNLKWLCENCDKCTDIEEELVIEPSS